MGHVLWKKLSIYKHDEQIIIFAPGSRRPIFARDRKLLNASRLIYAVRHFFASPSVAFDR
jgi:hypothetical protein